MGVVKVYRNCELVTRRYCLDKVLFVTLLNLLSDDIVINVFIFVRLKEDCGKLATF